MALVVVENLSKIFKGPRGETISAVTDANLTVNDGELLVLVGPSGCGKSTTLRMIAGLEEISSGTISIDGRAVNGVPPKDRDIAMVFQNFALYPHMTVRENLAFGLMLRKVGSVEIQERVNRAAEMLGLNACLDRHPQELSGGERQRVSLGRAIVRQPKLFLFDEPLSNLDAQMRVQMRREIATLHHQLSATMVYVTHDQVEAMTLGDRIAVMRAGVIQQIAEPMALYHQPANIFVAGFIGSPAMNFFQGTLVKKEGAFLFQADAFTARVDAAMETSLSHFNDKKIVLGLRPENISDVPDGRTANEKVSVVAEMTEPLGAETYLYAKTGGHALVARIHEQQRIAAKETMPLYFDMKHAHFFDPVTEKAIASQSGG
ncbi:MAG TPA: sn-glycerol-3-phosphate ABC transporter ATP-binding protein UgpC [Verrucomicrobiae bacterium]|jgi:multiple sugar transport system ATP-binding protein|nr:sn-glycerol-3-phosphate ABC transporter ATP-binding protein UgpC [Verrucomicrobiae bacterium]